MADIQINELLESTTAANSDWIAIDNGTATKKISVQNFNSTGAASAAQSAAVAAQSATDATSAKNAAVQAKDDTQALITSAQTIVSNAQTYAGEAATSANSASTAASTATAQAAIATNQANLAAGYAQNVDNFAKNAKSWAVGGTGTRQGEDTDNSKYYSQQAHDSEINAAASESNASTSETNAAASESTASSAASSASTNALKAEGYAVGTQNGTPAASGETYYHDNAKYYKEEAATSATNAGASETNAGLSEAAAAASATAAGESEDDSEAWAWGKVNGVDVPSSHPAYHNNAKYWADNAAGAAGGGVTSFNGRNGIVVPDSTDYDAGMIPYDNTNSGLTATTTQNAIDEVQYNIDTLNGSLKPVAKSGVYNDLTEKPTLGTAAAKNATNTIAEDSTDLIQSGAVYDALELKANAVDLGTAAAKASTNAVTEDSTDLVESGAVFSELATRDAEIADMNNILGAKNILPNKAVTKTVNGITFTVNSDGSITVSGVATVETQFIFCDSLSLEDDTDYILTGCPSGGSGAPTYLIQILKSGVGSFNETGSGKAVHWTSSYNGAYVRILIGNGQDFTTSKTFYPMIRLASIQDDTYEPYSMTNREMTPYVQAISNPNLLDNPWFTVNQREQSSYTYSGGSAPYIVDRFLSARAIVNVSANGIDSIIYDQSSSDFGYIGQPIEEALAKLLAGKIVTMSMLFSDGKIISKSGICPNLTPSGAEYGLHLGEESDDYYAILYVTASGNLSFHIRSKYTVAQSRGIRAVKLELGSVSTLAMDTAPNYATELLKCQRYFVRLKTDNVYGALSVMGRCASTSDARITLFLPATMRRNPNISIGGSIMIHDDTSNSNINDVTLGQNTMTSFSGYFGVVKITSTNNEYTVGHMVEIFAKNDASACIDLSADL